MLQGSFCMLRSLSSPGEDKGEEAVVGCDDIEAVGDAKGDCRLFAGGEGDGDWVVGFTNV